MARPFTPESLALFRIAFGTTLLINFWERFRDGQIDLFYTEGGLIPISVRGLTVHWSLLDAFNTPLSFRLALVGMILCVLCYTIGLCTRFTKWGVVFILLSLYHRSPLVDDGSDWVMRLWAIWTAFLPLGQVWSVDAKYFKERFWAREPSAPIASILLLVNLSLSYLLNVTQKSADSWSSGEATFMALHMPLYASPIGVWLRSSFLCPALPAVSLVTLGVECSLAILVLVSCRSRVAKLATFIGMFYLHGSFLLTMRLGTFPWIYLALALLFLPFTRSYGVTQNPLSRGYAFFVTTLPIVFGILCLSALLRLNPSIPAPLKAAADKYTPPIFHYAGTLLAVPQQWYMFSDVSSTMRIFSLRVAKHGEAAVDPARARESSPARDMREPTRLSKYWTSYILRMVLPDYMPYRVPLTKYYYEAGFDEVSLLFTHARAPQSCGGDYSNVATETIFSESRLSRYDFSQRDIVATSPALPYVVVQHMSPFGQDWWGMTQIHGRFGPLANKVVLEFFAPRECLASGKIELTTAPDFGLLEIVVNQDHRTEVSAYNSLGVFRKEADLGRIPIVAGKNRLGLTSLEEPSSRRDKFGILGISWQCS